jgi:hypothetical protein
MKSKQKTASLYEIKITLMNMAPSIWRRVTVPLDITLGNLHTVIQIAMGWEDDHLHEFLIGRKRYGPVIPDKAGFGEPAVNEDIVCLNGVAKPHAKFIYHYDFGDDWRHEIHIEREIEEDLNPRQVRCVAGENACPPEDCGGPYGYFDLIAILRDAQHEEHNAMQEWIGEDFDPKYFDLASIDRRLSKLKA